MEHGFVLARAQGELAERRLGRTRNLLHNWLQIFAARVLICDEFMEARTPFAIRGGFLGEVYTA